jgi:hypothetical protein
MTTEGWIWQQVQAGQIADLNDRCDTPPLSVYQTKDPLWQAPCRRVDPVLLRALLTQTDLADQAPYDVRILGARIDGPLDLSDCPCQGGGGWVGCLLDYRIRPSNQARLDGILSFDVSLIEKGLGAQLAVIGLVTMQSTEFGGEVALTDAHVEDQMSLIGATIAKGQTFEASQLFFTGLPC